MKTIIEQTYQKDTLFVNNYLYTKELFNNEINVNSLTLDELTLISDILKSYRNNDIIASMFLNFLETLKSMSLLTEIPIKLLFNDFTDSLRQPYKKKPVTLIIGAKFITLENLHGLDKFSVDEKRALLKDYYRSQIK